MTSLLVTKTKSSRPLAQRETQKQRTVRENTAQSARESPRVVPAAAETSASVSSQFPRRPPGASIKSWRAGARCCVTSSSCKASWSCFRWAACRGSASRWESCRPAVRRRAVRWLDWRRCAETAAVAAACRSGLVGSDIECGSIPPERTATSPEDSLCGRRLTVHKRLKQNTFPLGLSIHYMYPDWRELSLKIMATLAAKFISISW